MYALPKHLFAFVVFTCIAVSSFAQDRKKGWDASSKYGRMFNPLSMITIDGTVETRSEFRPNLQMCCGVHLMVTTDTGNMAIHLGPAWYVDAQKVEIEEGDKVTVSGSLVNFDEETAVMATELKKDEKVLKLRDEQGFPYWETE